MEAIFYTINEGTITLKCKDGDTITIDSKGGKNSSIFDGDEKIIAKDKNGKNIL